MKLATIVYLRKEGKTLMLLRNKKAHDMHEGLWNGLGGKLEEGESPERCAIREVREESGLTIREPRLRGILTFPNGVDKDEAWYVFLYEANSFRGRQHASAEGELAWIRDEELLHLKLNEGDYLWMKWLLEGRLFSGTFLYEERKLKRWEVTFHDKGNKELFQ